MIPKQIHYCWFGETPPSDLMLRCIESWRRVMPGYRVKEWNETNSPIDNAYTKTAFRKRQWSKLSNYVRLHALHAEGGIYLDTDVDVLRPFDPLLGDPCFLGFQLSWHPTDWVNNAVMGAQRGHPFLDRCMQLTRKLFREDGRLYRSPEVPTTALKAMGLVRYGLQHVGDVALYPTDFLYPYAWFEEFSPDRLTEDTYCIHRWAGSWVKQEPLVFKMVKDFRRALGITTSRGAA